MGKSAFFHFDVAVIGGGPAGMAAAVAASRAGASVALLDDNPAVGGQIWRGEAQAGGNPEAARWFRALGSLPVEVISGAGVFHIESGVLVAETAGGVLAIAHRELILATGARELFLPFPGWTLPNVFGAGGLQALLKTGLPVEQKRITIAGTGPLLLAVASYARKRGAQVLGICEQAGFEKMARFGMAAARLPRKLKEGVLLGWDLRGIPYWTNCWPIAAIGRERIESVRLLHNGRIREMECDYLACGFHLVPNIELAQYVGCRIEAGFVKVDEFQRTSVPNVYCAGEPTSIGGLELSILEGQIAGSTAAGDRAAARRLFAERARYVEFAAELARAFKLRGELKSLADPGTLLCRCEDVPVGRVSPFDSWRAAKLHTRCGMGPCQGRVCGSAAEFLFGWGTDSVRPPVLAVDCASLAAASNVGPSGKESI
ncbi:MAG TPA: FAD/NAD(P)-binding oxidoreductase [Candidatus Cybelea sp.]|nr:FAD/NAD(P)-binding oxidoreductase [Candidatus Cybelea sp.]